MKLVAVLCFCMITLSGCRGVISEDALAPRRVPDTARIVCERDGTHALTPKVRARPDGVHFVIENRLDKDTGYSVESHDGGGMGDNAPEGESRHIGGFPPGKVRIGCEKPPVDGIGTDYAKLTVLAGDSGYKPVELECPSGEAVSGMDIVGGDATVEKENPVELVRRRFLGRLEEGDVVETAGYPEIRNQRTVRVVRDGRIVFTVSYHRKGGGWLEDGFAACQGF